MNEIPNDIPNDIPADVLADMSRQTLYPETLQHLVDESRRHFGWFTKHSTRCIEYPWLVERCRPLGRRMLDVGAGVSPVPLYLAQHCGKEVVTVDYSPSVVNLARIRRRNEWGFLDYSQIDDRISSHNVDIATFSAEEKFDVVYSISVIEHMPARIRREMIRFFGEASHDESDIVLTVDLYGRSIDLWNFDRGQEVEPTSMHGTLATLVGELQDAGFDLVYLETLRRAPAGKPGDLALLHATRR